MKAYVIPEANNRVVLHLTDDEAIDLIAQLEERVKHRALLIAQEPSMALWSDTVIVRPAIVEDKPGVIAIAICGAAHG